MTQDEGKRLTFNLLWIKKNLRFLLSLCGLWIKKKLRFLLSLCGLWDS